MKEEEIKYNEIEDLDYCLELLEKRDKEIERLNNELRLFKDNHEHLNNLLQQKDEVIKELLERIANLERNIEEAREFLVHSSISIEDMERVDEIFGS